VGGVAVPAVLRHDLERGAHLEQIRRLQRVEVQRHVIVIVGLDHRTHVGVVRDELVDGGHVATVLGQLEDVGHRRRARLELRERR
jgi:hypothetical protein